MSNQIIITKWEQRIVSFTLEEGRMVGANVEPTQTANRLGNVYVGKVKNIVENIGAAFVEVEKGVICYMSLSEKGEPVFVNAKKNKKVTIGDELLVQITRENVKTKQCVASFNFSLTGKNVVLAKGKDQVFLSSKIQKEEERKRLRDLMEGRREEGFGFIVRTNAMYATDRQILEETRMWVELYGTICKEGVHRTCFSCILKAPSGYVCDIRDANQNKLDRIVTDDEDLHLEIRRYLERYQKEDLPKLCLYEDEDVPIHAVYGLRSQFEKAFHKKVWLKSGGSVIIEHTEACTVIDVNTEKAIWGKKKSKATYLKVNLEAAKEIAHQLRLRNISGIILVDFIDMESSEDRRELMRYLSDAVRRDPVKTDVVDMTKLGLVELTRKKIRKPLYEQWRM